MVDPDLELRKGPVIFSLSVPSFLSFYDFFTQNKGRGMFPPALPLNPPLEFDKYKEIT